MPEYVYCIWRPLLNGTNNMKKRGFRCPFPGCQQLYASNYNVTRHIACMHPNFVPNQCVYCLRVLSSVQNCIQHQFTHTGAKPYICEICGKSYRQRSQLSFHKRGHNLSPDTIEVRGVKAEEIWSVTQGNLILPPICADRRFRGQLLPCLSMLI